MTEFVHLDLPNYNQSLEEMKLLSKSCICCLRVNIPLLNLLNCKHRRILDFVYRSQKQHSSYRNSTVCHSCHCQLKKCDNFITQVEESLAVTLSRSSTASTVPKIQTQILMRSNLELNSAIDCKPIEYEIIKSVTGDIPDFDVETIVKIEHDSSDFETDVPLSQIKIQTSSQQKIHNIVSSKKNKTSKLKNDGKKNAKPQKKLRTPFQKKYDGKINVVMLSMKEMLLEREEESLKKSYLKLPFKCKNCITGFDHESTLLDHMEKRHSQKNGIYRCGICNSVLSTKSSYNEHSKRHLRRYECCVCGKRNNNVYSVLQHYNEQHGNIDVNYECNLCDFTAESYRSYRYHREKHRSGKVECGRCKSTFVNKGGLRVHMITIHGESSREYSCEQCGRRYRCKSSLAAHLARHSSTPAYCVECDTHFRSDLGLRNHLKTHSKHVLDADKRFTCNECGSKFLKKSSLQEHIDWKHLNNIKFACNKCSKVFKNRSSLRKHRDFVHDKKRPPRNKICDHCGRGFTTISILQSHIRTHTGERPLQCPNCPATFAHSAALYTHNKLLHTARAT